MNAKMNTWPQQIRTTQPVLEQDSLLLDMALVLAIPLIGIIDGVVGGQIRLTAFFLIPIMLITWRKGAVSGYLATLFSLGILLFVTSRDGAMQAHPQAFAIDAAGRFISFFVIVAILARLRRLYGQQRRMATRDMLTGLHNRLGLLEILGVEMEIARRKGQALAIVFIDCDNFKYVNDKWGHQAGDRLLMIVGEALKKTVRRSDVACRLGGDEFVAFFPNIAADEAERLIHKLKSALDGAMHEWKWPVTFSMGAAIFRHIPADPEQIVDLADALMYEAKHAGKNTVRIVNDPAARTM